MNVMNRKNEEVKAGFKTLIEKARVILENKMSLDEENTKMALILPFFSILGYDVFDPVNFRAEMLSDCRAKGNEKVDYSVFVDGKPKLIIEAKRLSESLKDHIGQLQRYYNTNVEIRYGILTNGVHYLFFTDSIHANIMDDKPFYELNLMHLDENDFTFLKEFYCESFSKDNPRINRMIIEQKLESFIKKQAIDPTPELVSFIENHLHIGTIDAEQIKNVFMNVAKSKGQVPAEVNSPPTTLMKSTSNVGTGKGKTKARTVIPKTISFQNEVIIASTWREIFVSILELLIKRKPDVMKQLDTLFISKKRIVFSYDEKSFPDYSQHLPLSNGLFVMVTMDSLTMKRTLSKVVSICGYLDSDLIISDN